MNWLFRLIFVCIIAVFAFFSPVYYLFNTDKSSTDATIIIPAKTNTEGVVRILQENKVISRALPFKIIAYVNKTNGRYLQPGEYFIPQGTSSKETLHKIIKGDRVIHKITIPEGFTNFQISQLLDGEQVLKGDAKPTDVEGSYMPDTYHYYYDTQRSVILNKMFNAMSNFTNPLIPEDKKNEVMILASIVEKEAKIPSERPIIASVYLNRIAQKMPLQADPTVIYALKKGKTDFSHILSRDDLKFDSPYNTYVYAGLPPTPICNPGKESIKAVLNPAKTDYLYFVADGTGNHIFATSYKDHLSNIAKIKAQ